MSTAGLRSPPPWSCSCAAEPGLRHRNRDPERAPGLGACGDLQLLPAPEQSENIRERKELGLSTLVCACGMHFDFCLIFDETADTLCSRRVPRTQVPGKVGMSRGTVRVQRRQETLSLEVFPQPMQISLVLNIVPSCLSFSKHSGALSPPYGWVY